MTTFNAPAERDINWGPERTSIVAILALVFALPCFIPGVGVIASLLAVFALVGIAGSKGRVGGTGLAIAALVLGLFSTALWTALGYGAWQAVSFFDKQIVGSTALVMNDIRDGEWEKVKGRFVPASAEKLTPERFEAFRASYREKLGEFTGAPSGLRDIIDDYSKLGPLMSNLKNPPNNTIPVPLRFEKGPALLMMEFDPAPRAKPANPGTPDAGVMKALPIRNLTLLGQGGIVVVLIDPALLPANSAIEFKGSGTRIKIEPPTQEAAPGEKAPEKAQPPESPVETPAAPKKPN